MLPCHSGHYFSETAISILSALFLLVAFAMVFDHTNRKAMNALYNALLCLLSFFSFIYSIHLYVFCKYASMYIVFLPGACEVIHSVKKTCMVGN